MPYQKHLLIALASLFLLTAANLHAFYAAEAGRWINRDPIGERGGINTRQFVVNSPVNAIDFFGLDGTSAGKIVGGLKNDEVSNCLGYAMTGDPTMFAQPAPGQSTQKFLEENGWKCTATSDPAKCQCDCKQDKMVLYTEVAIIGSNSDKDPYRDPMDYGKGTAYGDYHGMRASGGCKLDYTQIFGSGDKTRKPEPAKPYKPTKGPAYCCCKDASQ